MEGRTGRNRMGCPGAGQYPPLGGGADGNGCSTGTHLIAASEGDKGVFVSIFPEHVHDLRWKRIRHIVLQLQWTPAFEVRITKSDNASASNQASNHLLQRGIVWASSLPTKTPLFDVPEKHEVSSGFVHQGVNPFLDFRIGVRHPCVPRRPIDALRCFDFTSSQVNLRLDSKGFVGFDEFVRLFQRLWIGHNVMVTLTCTNLLKAETVRKQELHFLPLFCVVLFGCFEVTPKVVSNATTMGTNEPGWTFLREVEHALEGFATAQTSKGHVVGR
ncbi:hypothetical protein RQP54_11245 [Curvibacter sp. APW13]|uniref:hypothetical protein n=1 Tax=Curvibacter sp. APW13 TaxID=3077236 RepID=UPI0028E0898F|nr:hypothetical protein [Curvibacter sp. APW13]MDT8991436.1 hypothetical protein [Curvibacter sp. APW13]